jgi:hypothetical protein
MLSGDMRRAARRWPGGGAPRGGEWGLGGPFHHATPSGRAIAADRAGEDRARGDGESDDKDRRGNEAHRHGLRRYEELGHEVGRDAECHEDREKGAGERPADEPRADQEHQGGGQERRFAVPQVGRGDQDGGDQKRGLVVEADPFRPPRQRDRDQRCRREAPLQRQRESLGQAERDQRGIGADEELRPATSLRMIAACWPAMSRRAGQ